MRSYRSKRSSNVKVKKILFRILFVIVTAIVITVLAMLLGHSLLDRVNSLDSKTNDTPTETKVSEIEPSDEYIITSINAPSVFASCIDPTSFENEEDMVNKIDELSGEYDTLIVNLIANDGSLIYRSPAICKLLGIPVGEDDGMLQRIVSAVSAASVRNMRICAAIPSSAGGSASASAAVIDSALIRELSSIGFDEVMMTFDEFKDADMTQNTALQLYQYLKDCAADTPSILMGVALPAEVYLDASNSKQIQIISSTVSFLGIKFSTEGMTTSTEIFSSVSHDIASLLGAFRTYNMRLIIDNGDIAAMAAEYTACIHNDMKNVCIMAPLMPDELEYDQNAAITPEETAPETDEKEPEETQSNPYASTKDDYPDAPKPADTVNDAEEPKETDKPWY